ncbi:MAG: hypothetical protein WB768_01800, partial [Bradyrhizobium sp.]
LVTLPGCNVNKADHWNGGLLRARRKRPRDCCSGKKGDESAALHIRPQAQEADNSCQKAGIDRAETGKNANSKIRSS